jgi:hypothetical protein
VHCRGLFAFHETAMTKLAVKNTRIRHDPCGNQ